ncbi:flagellar hook-basal body complex protein FliE [Variovorax boronicumulans]|uniref:flagellar hook-basal body complex protein FliE n=1 Tax=Variovorax boronicumulans TaxID=436515 RepID=UPI00277E4804|nr:flagellar hook-basal body complex protein FliE [Variovorax boronicumulans]MDQ0045430.1 flagellar hook-basal body complex protein FliE [Variovorax boronicumulans]
MSALLPAEALSALSSQAQSMVAGAQALSSVQAGGAAGAANLSEAQGIPGTSATGSFARMVSDGISQINNKLVDGEIGLQKLAVGDAQNLHQLMINLEESRLSFQLMMQVRGRLLEAYQDIMKMPI